MKRLRLIPFSKEATCYHEAGHAVMGFLFHVPTISIDIYDYANGYVNAPIHYPTAFFSSELYNNTDNETKAILLKDLDFNFQKYAMINFAGYLSEYKFKNWFLPYYPQFILSTGVINPENDFTKVYTQIKKANNLLGFTHYDRSNSNNWQKEAREVLVEKGTWKAVKQLATELVNAKQLLGNNEGLCFDGGKAEEIIYKALKK